MSLFKRKPKTIALDDASEYIQSSTKILNLMKQTKEAMDIMFDMCAKNNPEGYVEEAFLKINRDPLTMLTFDAEAIEFMDDKNPEFTKEHHLEEMVEYARTFYSDFKNMCLYSFAYQYMTAKGIDIKDSFPIPMSQAPYVAYLSPAVMLNFNPAQEIATKPPKEQAALSSDVWKNTLWIFDNFYKDDAPYEQIMKDMDVNGEFRKFVLGTDGQVDFTEVIKDLMNPKEFKKRCKQCGIKL